MIIPNQASWLAVKISSTRLVLLDLLWDIGIYGCREKRAREMLKETEKNKGAAYCNL